ncbi:MAG: GDP-L-fucose synthase family protein [Bauldia sp.]
MFNLSGRRVFVAGHKGMVGSAVVRRLSTEDCDILVADRSVLDLRSQQSVDRWMDANRPDVMVIAAATVGGILANDSRPADFIYDNLVIETNLIHAAHRTEVAKLVFLGSSCIYPRDADQPMREEALLTGPLEPTNQWYAIAKIAGIKMCQAYRKQHGRDFISAMPTNLYGPNDNFDLTSSHVLPALMRRTHMAKVEGRGSLEIWGTGTPRREFLHVDDCADAIVFLLKAYSGDQHVNVGTGTDIAIRDLARLIADVVGFEGDFLFDTTKPDGTPRKLMDGTRLRALGWQPRIGLSEGVRATYAWFLANEAGLRGTRSAA